MQTDKEDVDSVQPFKRAINVCYYLTSHLSKPSVVSFIRLFLVRLERNTVNFRTFFARICFCVVLKDTFAALKFVTGA